MPPQQSHGLLDRFGQLFGFGAHEKTLGLQALGSQGLALTDRGSGIAAGDRTTPRLSLFAIGASIKPLSRKGGGGAKRLAIVH
jgi:hypothetical protein